VRPVHAGDRPALPLNRPTSTSQTSSFHLPAPTDRRPRAPTIRTRDDAPWNVQGERAQPSHQPAGEGGRRPELEATAHVWHAYPSAYRRARRREALNATQRSGAWRRPSRPPVQASSVRARRAANAGPSASLPHRRSRSCCAGGSPRTGRSLNGVHSSIMSSGAPTSVPVDLSATSGRPQATGPTLEACLKVQNSLAAVANPPLSALRYWRTRSIGKPLLCWGGSPVMRG
jgi:hypothetical protein